MKAGDGKTDVAFLWTSKDGTFPTTHPPPPVMGLALQRFDQLLMGGHPHGQWFKIEWDGDKYECYVRADGLGGYKIIVLVSGGKFTNFFMFRDNLDDNDLAEYYGHFLDNKRERIQPLDDSEEGPRLIGFTVPTEIKTAFTQADITPLAGLELPSRYTGLVRSGVQMSHFRGENSPFHRTLAIHHHIVETPHPRVDNQPGQFFLCELRVTQTTVTAYFYPINGPQVGLQAWKIPNLFQTTPGFKYDLPQALVDGEIVPVAAGNIVPNLGIPGLANQFGDGWASSYSGHEAMGVFQNSTSGGFARVRVQFTLTPNVMSPYGFDFSISVLNIENGNGIRTNGLRYFKEGLFPSHYLDSAFPQNVGLDSSGVSAPIRCWYDGDQIVIVIHTPSTAVNQIITFSPGFNAPSVLTSMSPAIGPDVCNSVATTHGNINYQSKQGTDVAPSGENGLFTLTQGVQVFPGLYPFTRVKSWSSRTTITSVGALTRACGPWQGCSGIAQMNNGCECTPPDVSQAQYQIGPITDPTTLNHDAGFQACSEGAGSEIPRVITPWYEREGIIIGVYKQFANSSCGAATFFGTPHHSSTATCHWVKISEFQDPDCPGTFPPTSFASYTPVRATNLTPIGCGPLSGPPAAVDTDTRVKSKITMIQRGRVFIDEEFSRQGAAPGVFQPTTPPDEFPPANLWQQLSPGAFPGGFRGPFGMCGNAEYYEDAALKPPIQDMNMVAMSPNTNWRNTNITAVMQADYLDWFTKHVRIFSANAGEGVNVLPAPPALSAPNQGYLQPILWGGWVGRI